MKKNKLIGFFLLVFSFTRLTSTMKLVTSPEPTCWCLHLLASTRHSTRSTCWWPKTATPASSALRPTGISCAKPNPTPRLPISPGRNRRCELSPRRIVSGSPQGLRRQEMHDVSCCSTKLDSAGADAQIATGAAVGGRVLETPQIEGKRTLEVRLMP